MTDKQHPAQSEHMTETDKPRKPVPWMRLARVTYLIAKAVELLGGFDWLG